MKWLVWGRCVLKDGSITEWHRQPRQYKSKSAAHRALEMLQRPGLMRLRIMDAEAAYEHWRFVGVAAIQHFATPDGMVPTAQTVIRYIKD